MSVAEDDSYPVPDDVLARFAALSRRTGTLTMLRHARIAERMGISGTDSRTLDLLDEAGEPLTAGRIAELTGLSTGAVTGVVDRLERVGFVRRVRDRHDRRKVLVESLPAERERFAPLFETAVTGLAATLEKFSPAEREIIERFHREMIESLRNETWDTPAT